MDRKSKLSSKTISKVWLNKKNYKFLDFDFKVENLTKNWYGNKFDMEVYNHNVLILRLDINEFSEEKRKDRRFRFRVSYFNPQTDNDCFSINHIIAVSSEYCLKDEMHKDNGNAEVMDNQFIFRKKDNFYTYVKIWVRGEIRVDNWDKFLSYEFATDEYINYIKKIFGIKKMQRRTIKKQWKGYLDKILLMEALNKK